MREREEHDEHSELSLKESNFIDKKQHVFLSYNCSLLKGEEDREV